MNCLARILTQPFRISLRGCVWFRRNRGKLIIEKMGRPRIYSIVKKNPLYVITLCQTKSDNINRMITITDDFQLATLSKWDLSMLITFSGFQCTKAGLLRLCNALWRTWLIHDFLNQCFSNGGPRKTLNGPLI